MSAWIVSKAHIDFMVDVPARDGVIADTQEAKNLAGLELWNENHRSVNTRYGESTPTPDYVFEPSAHSDKPTDSAFTAKQFACYDYQTCEHGGYDDSWARRTIAPYDERYTELQHATEADAAPWGID